MSILSAATQVIGVVFFALLVTGFAWLGSNKSFLGGDPNAQTNMKIIAVTADRVNATNITSQLATSVLGVYQDVNTNTIESNIGTFNNVSLNYILIGDIPTFKGMYGISSLEVRTTINEQNIATLDRLVKLLDPNNIYDVQVDSLLINLNISVPGSSFLNKTTISGSLVSLGNNVYNGINTFTNQILTNLIDTLSPTDIITISPTGKGVIIGSSTSTFITTGGYTFGVFGKQVISLGLDIGGSQTVGGDMTISGTTNTKDLFVNSLNSLYTNTIQSVTPDSNIVLTPQGSGSVIVQSPLSVLQGVSFASTVNVAGTTTSKDIWINSLNSLYTNTIQSTSPNSNILLSPQGTGIVVVQSPFSVLQATSLASTLNVADTTNTMDILINSLNSLYTNTIQSTSPNSNILLSPQGTGTVVIQSSLTVAQSVSISSNLNVVGTMTAANLQIQNSLNLAGNETISQNLAVNGITSTGDLIINPSNSLYTNTIQSNSLNSSISITAQGSGSINMQSNLNINQGVNVLQSAYFQNGLRLAQGSSIYTNSIISDLVGANINILPTNGIVNIGSATTVNGLLNVVGDINVAGASTVYTNTISAIDTSTNGTITTNSNVNIQQGLSVFGGGYFGKDVEISELSTLHVNSIKTVFSGDNFNINPISGTIGLGANTIITGTLNVNGTVYANSISSVNLNDNLVIGAQGTGRVIFGQNGVNGQVEFVSGGGVGPSDTDWITTFHNRPSGSVALVTGVYYDSNLGVEKSTLGAYYIDLSSYTDLYMNPSDFSLQKGVVFGNGLLPSFESTYLPTLLGTSYTSNEYNRVIVENSLAVEQAVYAGLLVYTPGPVYTSGVITLSDQTVKTNFTLINGTFALNAVLNTPPYLYNYNTSVIILTDNMDPSRQIPGFKAQDVMTYFPQVVTQTTVKIDIGNGTYESVKKLALNKDNMIPFLWSAVQELAAQIIVLQSQVAALQGNTKTV